MKTAGKKNLALVELILVILFFALSSMILVQVFVKARAMSDTSRASTLGLVAAQDLIEQLKAAPQEAERILTAEEGWSPETANENGQGYTAAYGADMKPVVTGEAVYKVCVAISEESREAGILYRMSVTIDRIANEERITELSTAHYVSGRQEEAP